MKARIAIAAGSVGALVAAALVTAGPLNPPAGPVAPTHKTLGEVEPRTAINAANTPGDVTTTFKITQPGSYYLTSNLSGSAGKIVILIASADVTVDLHGFTITGGTSAIGHVVNYPDITVRNGAISGCTSSGIDLSGSEGTTIEGIAVTNAGAHGVFVGSNAQARGVRADNCQGYGILAGGGGLIQGCTVSGSGGPLTAAFQVYHGTRVIDCIARNNNGTGFHANGEDCAFSGCTSRYSQGDGFFAVGACRFEQCLASNSESEGFRGGSGTVVVDCTSQFNGLRGFRVGNTSTVRACQARGNGTAGSYAGIWLDGAGSRAEDNEMTDNDIGLYTISTDNVIVRNTARNNAAGDFYVGAGNEFAPVVTNPGSNGFSTMTPWSNVAY